jgi:hypothetical protein
VEILFSLIVQFPAQSALLIADMSFGLSTSNWQRSCLGRIGHQSSRGGEVYSREDNVTSIGDVEAEAFGVICTVLAVARG